MSLSCNLNGGANRITFKECENNHVDPSPLSTTNVQPTLPPDLITFDGGAPKIEDAGSDKPLVPFDTSHSQGSSDPDIRGHDGVYYLDGTPNPQVWEIAPEHSWYDAVTGDFHSAYRLRRTSDSASEVSLSGFQSDTSLPEVNGELSRASSRPLSFVSEHAAPGTPMSGDEMFHGSAFQLGSAYPGFNTPASFSSRPGTPMSISSMSVSSDDQLVYPSQPQSCPGNSMSGEPKQPVESKTLLTNLSQQDMLSWTPSAEANLNLDISNFPLINGEVQRLLI
jgi:hypothetical protein